MEHTLQSKYKQDLSVFSEFFDRGFEVTPSVVVFQKFTIADTLRATVTVRNVTQVIRSIVIEYGGRFCFDSSQQTIRDRYWITVRYRGT